MRPGSGRHGRRDTRRSPVHRASTFLLTRRPCLDDRRSAGDASTARSRRRRDYDRPASSTARRHDRARVLDMINSAVRAPRNQSLAIPHQLLTVSPALPMFRFAVAPVTQSLGGVTCKRLHWSGVVRRGAVDTTPDFTVPDFTTPEFTVPHPTPRRPEHSSREHA